jgi:hypothetical protein
MTGSSRFCVHPDIGLLPALRDGQWDAVILGRVAENLTASMAAD